MAYKNKEKEAEYYRKYYLLHKDKKAEQRKVLYLKNRDAILKKMREEYIPNPRILKTAEQKREKQQHWREANRDKYNSYMREWTRKNAERLKPIRNYYYNNRLSLRVRFNRLNIGAQSRNHIIEITLDEFSKLVAEPCMYCGESKLRRGIDRVDNKKGYTKDNSVPCCKLCNYMKRNISVEDFLLHIKKINKHSNYSQRHRNRNQITRRRDPDVVFRCRRSPEGQ